MARTVNFCLRYYEKHHVEKHVVDKERVMYCHKALRPKLGRRQAERLANRDIRAYTEKRTREGVSNGTIGREIASLLAALRFCWHEGVIETLPPLKRLKKPPARDIWLSRAQADRLIECASPRVKLFIQIALETGGRPEAIDTLKWSQVDLDQKLLYFNDRGREQTNKRRPVVPMSDRLVTILLREQQQARNKWVLGKGSSTWKGFKGALRRAGLDKEITRKTLRHTWATWKAQAGASMWDIAGVLGTSVQTAQRNYAHHSPDHLRDVVNL